MSERALCQAPIEPLSQQAWRRVETAVFARLDDSVVMQLPVAPHHSYAAPRARRPLRWHWAIGMGLSVAAAAVASVVHGVNASRPAALENEAPLTHSGVATPTAPGEVALGAPPPPVAPEAPITAQDGLRVATGQETRRIAVGDSQFTLSERSEMVARGNDRDGWNVSLSRGRVEFDVAPRGSRPPFIIQSGDVRVRVVGTRFSVRRQGASTQVRVQRGVVEVEHGGQTARLGPGDVWLDGVRVGALGKSDAEKTESRGPQRSRTDRAAARSNRERRFNRAASLESEDPAQALDVYLGLARGADAWAANALYAAARLELDQGDRRSGARLLEDYLERFPEGGNSVDVQSLFSRLGMTPDP